jgi:hypothetical protein
MPEASALDGGLGEQRFGCRDGLAPLPPIRRASSKRSTQSERHRHRKLIRFLSAIKARVAAPERIDRTLWGW